VTLVVGLAVAEAVEGVAPEVRVSLKWPNDLQVGPRKLGGVLCESAGDAVVAGIGINLRSVPPEVRERATSLEVEASRSLPASELAGSIVAALRRREAPGAALDADVLGSLAARDALAGATLDTDEHGRGVGRGLDRDGALLLERPDGSRVRVMAGSVRQL
jgi:BirA family biotin operon repressor/biotin-[acetyl-CoA-carboxylase] ligase